MSRVSGHSTTFIWEKMSYAEALQYEQIWFLELNERRQTSAFSPVPMLRPVQRGRTQPEERI